MMITELLHSVSFSQDEKKTHTQGTTTKIKLNQTLWFLHHSFPYQHSYTHTHDGNAYLQLPETLVVKLYNTQCDYKWCEWKWGQTTTLVKDDALETAGNRIFQWQNKK